MGQSSVVGGAMDRLNRLEEVERVAASGRGALDYFIGVLAASMDDETWDRALTVTRARFGC